MVSTWPTVEFTALPIVFLTWWLVSLIVSGMDGDFDHPAITQSAADRAVEFEQWMRTAGLATAMRPGPPDPGRAS